MSYVELPLYRGSSSNVKVFRLRTINIYVTYKSCTNFRKNIFDKKKVINFVQLDLRFDPLCGGRRVIGISGSLIWSKPRWNWFLTPVMNFGEVRRVQLAKYTHPTSKLVPLGSFMVCSDAKERVGCGKQREASVSIIPNKTATWDCGGRPAFVLNCGLRASICSERPALGQNTLTMMMTVSDHFWNTQY